MPKTVTMEWSEYQSILSETEKLKATISDWNYFEERIESILLTAKERELKKKKSSWIPLTQAQIFERIELLVNKLSDKEFSEATLKWEKKLA